MPNRVDGIGEPLPIFLRVLYASIPVNAGLIVYSFGGLDAVVGGGARVWVFVGAMGTMWGFLRLLENVYPELPERTAIQLERQHEVFERVVMGNAQSGMQVIDLDPGMLGLTVAEIKRRQEEGGRPAMTIVDLGDALPDLVPAAGKKPKKPYFYPPSSKKTTTAEPAGEGAPKSSYFYAAKPRAAAPAAVELQPEPPAPKKPLFSTTPKGGQAPKGEKI